MPGLEAIGEYLAGDALPVHRATSWHLNAIRPRFAETSPIDPETARKVPGLPLGYCGQDETGEVFMYDEWQLYQAGLLTNLNGVILGEVGKGKSALVKTMILVGASFGYNALVTDVKGEYTQLARAILGSKVLRFGTDTSLFINPLDPVMDLGTQQDLVAAMVLTTLKGRKGQELNNREDSMLKTAVLDALRHFESGAEVPTLPAVVEKLKNPTQTMADSLDMTVEQLKELGKDMFLGLRELTEGDLVGMFHKPTTTGLFEDTPLLVMNCEGLRSEAAVLVATLVNFYQSVWAKKYPQRRFHRVFHDEAWDLTVYPGFVHSVRRAFKLGGSLGVANWIVIHHKHNLERSSKEDAVKDLIPDARTFVCFQQKKSEIESSATELGFNPADVERIVQQGSYSALWKIGDSPAIQVKTRSWPELLPIIETRHLAKGKEVPVISPT